MADPDLTRIPAGWESRGKPPTLFKRYTFDRYGDTRAFLDALAVLSEELGVHPQNINFATTYVNVTLEGRDGGELTDPDFVMAARIDALASGG